jgi:hypothetical protein
MVEDPIKKIYDKLEVAKTGISIDKFKQHLADSPDARVKLYEKFNIAESGINQDKFDAYLGFQPSAPKAAEAGTQQPAAPVQQPKQSAAEIGIDSTPSVLSKREQGIRQLIPGEPDQPKTTIEKARDTKESIKQKQKMPSAATPPPAAAQPFTMDYTRSEAPERYESDFEKTQTSTRRLELIDELYGIPKSAPNLRDNILGEMASSEEKLQGIATGRVVPQAVKDYVFTENPLKSGLDIIAFDEDNLERIDDPVSSGLATTKAYNAYSTLAKNHSNVLSNSLQDKYGEGSDWRSKLEQSIAILENPQNSTQEEIDAARNYYETIQSDEDFQEFISVYNKLGEAKGQYDTYLKSNKAFSDYKKVVEQKQIEVDEFNKSIKTLSDDYKSGKIDREVYDKGLAKIQQEYGSLGVSNFFKQAGLRIGNIFVSGLGMLSNIIPTGGVGFGDFMTELSLGIERQAGYIPLPTNTNMAIMATMVDFEGSRVQVDEQGNIVSVRDKDGYIRPITEDFAERFERSGAAKNAELSYTNFASTSTALLNGAIDLGVTVGLTRGFGATGMGATAATTSAIVTQYGGVYYRDAIQSGWDPNTAARYAALVTTGIGLASSVVPLEAMLAGVGTKAASKFSLSSLGNLAKLTPEAAAKATLQNIGNFFKTSGKYMVGEAIEESFLEKIPEYAINSVFNMIADGEDMDTNWTLEGAANDAILGAGLGWLGGTVIDAMNRNDYSKLAFYHGVVDPSVIEKYKEYVASEDEYNSLMERVNRTKGEYDAISPLLEFAQPHEKVELANLIDQRNVMQDFVDNLGSNAPESKREELDEIKEKIKKITEVNRIKRNTQFENQWEKDKNKPYVYYEKEGKYYKQLNEKNPEEISREYYNKVTGISTEEMLGQTPAQISSTVYPGTAQAAPQVEAEAPSEPAAEVDTAVQEMPQDRTSLVDYTVNYQGVEGRLELIDGDYYVRDNEGELTLVEGGLSEATNEDIGLKAIAPPRIVEEDSSAEVSTDFTNNTVTISRGDKSKTYTYDSVNTDKDGNTVSVNLINDKGERVTVRNQDAINRIELDKVLFELNNRDYEPSRSDIESAAADLGVEASVEPVQPERPSADIEASTEEATRGAEPTDATPRVGDKYTDGTNEYEIKGIDKDGKYKVEKTNDKGKKTGVKLTPDQMAKQLTDGKFTKITPESRQTGAQEVAATDVTQQARQVEPDTTATETAAEAKEAEETVKIFKERKLSLDERAKKLGYDGIRQFNVQNSLNEDLNDEEKALLQDYSDFQQEIRALKDENVIAKLSDDEFSTWSKANDITRDDLGKVVQKDEIELAAKRIRILNARGDSKKAESEFNQLKNSKRNDNWTIESWKERFDEDIEQSEIDDINSWNKEFNKSIDKAVESLLPESSAKVKTAAAETGTVNTVTTKLKGAKEGRTYIKTDDGKWYVTKKDGTPSKTEVKKQEFIDQLNNKLDAIQEQQAAEMVQRQQGEVGQEGSGQVEQGEQGQEAAQTEEQVVDETAAETGTVEQQVEEFGVAPEMVKPVVSLMDRLFQGLKNAGITAANTLSEWVGIGTTANISPEALKQITLNGEQVTVKALPDQLEIVNGFYSPIEKALLEIPQSKGTANQFLAQIKKAKGVKGDELQFTGLEQWLTDQGDNRITKQDVLDYMRDNRIEIVEVVKDNRAKELKRFDEILSILNSRGYDIRVEDYASSEMSVRGIDDGITFLEEQNGGFTKEELIRDGYTLKDTHDEDVKLLEEAQKEAANIRRLQQKDDNLQGTRFNEYQLEGEKENYKEVLVTLPSKPLLTAEEQIEYDALSKLNDKEVNSALFSDGSVKLMSDVQKSRFKELSAKHANKFKKSKPPFKSGHFEEPNILVHLRMNTRTDADGNKVLFLEELQSDWGQKGRKEGFETPEKKAELKKLQEDASVATQKFNEIEEELDKQYADKKKEGESRSDLRKRDSDFNKLAQEYASAEQKMFDSRRAFDMFQVDNRGEVPTAPFVTSTPSWVKLGIKTAIKEAINQGATKIAWTTGEQQNERYDLRKQVDDIGYSYNEKSNTYRIIGGKNGSAVFNTELKESELESNLGKDVSTKIIADKENSIGKMNFLRGDDLAVGGSGMKGFYDNIVPKEAKAVVKELTGKEGVVENVTIIKRENLSSEDKIYEAYDRQGGLIKRGRSESYIKKIAEQEGGEYKLVNARQTSTQQSIEITPELKASVSQGVPLFQQANAQFRIEAGRNLIEALQKFNGSPKAVTAIVHEIMHPTVVEIFNAAKEGNAVAQKHANTIVNEYNKANPKNKVTVDDMIAANDQFKAGKTTKKYRAVQEFIAEAWERYNQEGPKGFSKAFQDVLNAISDAFRQVYASMTGTQLTPELRKMFDELLNEDVQSSVEDMKSTESRVAGKGTLVEPAARKLPTKVELSALDALFEDAPVAPPANTPPTDAEFMSSRSATTDERKQKIEDTIRSIIAANPLIDIDALHDLYKDKKGFPPISTLRRLQKEIDKATAAERVNIALNTFVPTIGDSFTMSANENYTYTDNGWVDKDGNPYPFQDGMTREFLTKRILVDTLYNIKNNLVESAEEKAPGITQPSAVVNVDTKESLELKKKNQPDTAEGRTKKEVLTNLIQVQESLSEVLPELKVVALDNSYEFQVFCMSLGVDVNPTDGGVYITFPNGDKYIAINLETARPWEPYHEALHAYLLDVADVSEEVITVMQRALFDVQFDLKDLDSPSDILRADEKKLLEVDRNLYKYLIDFTRRYQDLSDAKQAEEYLVEAGALLASDRITPKQASLISRIFTWISRNVINKIFGKTGNPYNVDTKDGALRFIKMVTDGLKGNSKLEVVRRDRSKTKIDEVDFVLRSVDKPTDLKPRKDMVVASSRAKDNAQVVREAVINYISENGTRENKALIIEAAMTAFGTLSRKELEAEFDSIIRTTEKAEPLSDTMRGSSTDVGNLLLKLGIPVEGANELFRRNMQDYMEEALEDKDSMTQNNLQKIQYRLENGQFISGQDQAAVLMMISQKVAELEQIQQDLALSRHGKNSKLSTNSTQDLIQQQENVTQALVELYDTFRNIGSAAGSILGARSVALKGLMYDPLFLIASLEREAKKKFGENFELSVEDRERVTRSANNMKRLMAQYEALESQRHDAAIDSMIKLADDSLQSEWFKTAYREEKFDVVKKDFMELYRSLKTGRRGPKTEIKIKEQGDREITYKRRSDGTWAYREGNTFKAIKDPAKIISLNEEYTKSRQSRTNSDPINNPEYRTKLAAMAVVYWRDNPDKTAKEIAEYISSITGGAATRGDVLAAIIDYSPKATTEKRISTRYDAEIDQLKKLRKDSRAIQRDLKNFKKDFIKSIQSDSTVDSSSLESSLTQLKGRVEVLTQGSTTDATAISIMKDSIEEIERIIDANKGNLGKITKQEIENVSELISNIESGLKSNIIDLQINDAQKAREALTNNDIAAIARILPSYDTRRLNTLLGAKRAELQLARAELNKQAQDKIIELSLLNTSGAGRFKIKAQRMLSSYFLMARTLKAMGDISANFSQLNQMTYAGLLSFDKNMYRTMFGIQGKIIANGFYTFMRLALGKFGKGDMTRKIAKEYAAAQQFMEELKASQPQTSFIAEKAGLEFSIPGDLNSTEELYMSSAFNNLPIFAGTKVASEIHMSLYMNAMRLAAFNQFVNANPLATDFEYEQAAKHINELSGRAKLSKTGRAFVESYTGKALFAPRLYISQAKTIARTGMYVFPLIGQGAGFALAKTGVKGSAVRTLRGDVDDTAIVPPSVVRYYMWHQMRSVAGWMATSTILGFLASLFDDEDREEKLKGENIINIDFNPYSNNFLKSEVGNISFEGLSGFGGMTRAATRFTLSVLNDDRKKLDEEYEEAAHVVKFYNDNRDAADILTRFAKGKMSPALRTASAVATGSDYFGIPYHDNPLLARLAALGMGVLPIPAESAVDAYRKLGPNDSARDEALSAGIRLASGALGLNANEIPALRNMKVGKILNTVNIIPPLALSSKVPDNIRYNPSVKYMFKEDFDEQMGEYIQSKYGRLADSKFISGQAEPQLKDLQESAKEDIKRTASAIRARLINDYTILLKETDDTKK